MNQYSEAQGWRLDANHTAPVSVLPSRSASWWLEGHGEVDGWPQPS